jgi:predicted secreted hydrolase
VFGTFVERDGKAIELAADVVRLEELDRWTSPHTGAVYPSGWRLHVAGRPDLGLPSAALELTPLLLDQELAFERKPYWEGAVLVEGVLDGAPARGHGYVELTGYAP